MSADERFLRALSARGIDVARGDAALIYAHLRTCAHGQRSRRAAADTLNTTALVHEAWLKLHGREGGAVFRNRQHFQATAALAMRHLLVDHLRHASRGVVVAGDATTARVAGAAAAQEAARSAAEVLALHEALERLAGAHPRAAHCVELRFFGGLTEAEAAAALEVTERTVRRDWVFAQAWLRVELEGG